MAHTTIDRTAVAFFHKHAGYSYGSEGPEAGRIRCARALADAERAGSDAGFSFEWEHDHDIDSSEWRDDVEPYATWACYCRDVNGILLSSLHGIDFGPDGEPWDQPYRRVVEAELASEALA